MYPLSWIDCFTPTLSQNYKTLKCQLVLPVNFFLEISFLEPILPSLTSLLSRPAAYLLSWGFCSISRMGAPTLASNVPSFTLHGCCAGGQPRARIRCSGLPVRCSFCRVILSENQWRLQASNFSCLCTKALSQPRQPRAQPLLCHSLTGWAQGWARGPQKIIQ